MGLTALIMSGKAINFSYNSVDVTLPSQPLLQIETMTDITAWSGGKYALHSDIYQEEWKDYLRIHVFINHLTTLERESGRNLDRKKRFMDVSAWLRMCKTMREQKRRFC